MSALPTMAARFQPQRWSPVRQAIHALETGAVLTLTMKDVHSAHCSVCRFNDSYDGERAWTMTRRNGVITVTRTK